MPQPDYTTTQRVDDFRVGETVVVRDCIYANGSPLNVGATYTVKEVCVENAGRGSGNLLLEERQDGSFDGGSFGHLLFDHWEAALLPRPARPFKVGDRIVQTGPHYYLNGRTDREYHESPNGIGSTGVVDSLATADAPDNISVKWDGGVGSVIATDSIALIDDEVEDDGLDADNLTGMDLGLDDGPDLSDGDVRAGLPMEQAYPVGSVWNHISSGHQPVTITGYKVSDDGRREYVKVSVPEHIGQRPYSGDWIRGALDKYGTLVSLPGEVEDDGPRELKVGDRVVVTDKRTSISGCPVGSGESIYVGKVATIRSTYGPDDYGIDFDDESLSNFGSWSRDALDPAPAAEPFKVGDRVVVTGWGPAHFESDWNGPATVTAVRDDGSYSVRRDGPMGTGNFASEYIRPLDDGAQQVDDEAQRVADLKAEINLLKQAASDERRRLCAEIDSLKTVVAGLESNLADTEGRTAHLEAQVAEGGESLARTVAEANELEAALAYAEHLGGDGLVDRLIVYRQGWADALAD